MGVVWKIENVSIVRIVGDKLKSVLKLQLKYIEKDFAYQKFWSLDQITDIESELFIYRFRYW